MFGLKIEWNGKYNWEVTIPGEYKDRICGLCGKWDGDKENDFTLPDGVRSILYIIHIFLSILYHQ